MNAGTSMGPVPDAHNLTIDEIRRILGPEADNLSDDQVLMLNEECHSVAIIVCDLALSEGQVVAVGRG